jgi:hypothetical protein
MADILNIVMLPTYDVNTIAIADASTYDDPLTVVLPTLEINIPGYTEPVYLDFVIQSTNIFNSTDLGITTTGNEEPLPDGIYCIKYTIDPPLENYTDISILRVDLLQQKFDEAFMQLDMMECDRAIKMQSKVDLNTISFFINGAMASANSCATVNAMRLYQQASTMLNNFINTNCGCSGNNFIINFQY